MYHRLKRWYGMMNKPNSVLTFVHLAAVLHFAFEYQIPNVKHQNTEYFKSGNSYRSKLNNWPTSPNHSTLKPSPLSFFFV